MRKLKIIINALLAVVIIMMIVPVQEVFAVEEDLGQNEYNNFTYQLLENGTAEITGYQGEVDGDLIIPDSVDGHAVTRIGDSAFYGNDCTGSLTLPNSLISIGDMAFAYGRFTGNLLLPKSIESIGNEAFYQCNFVGNLILPDSLSSIGSKAFFESWSGGWSETHSLICNKIPEDTSDTAFFEELVIGGCYGNMRVGEKNKLIISGAWDCEKGIISEIKNNSSSIVDIDNNGIITAISDGVAKLQITAYNGEVADLRIRVYGDNEKVQKGDITWFIPERIKLGYKYRDDTAALHNSSAYSGVAIAEVKNLPIDSLGKFIKIKNLYGHFSMPFTYDSTSLIKTNEVVYPHFEGYYAIRPGKITCQLEIGQYKSSQIPGEPSIWESEPLGDPYTITIEEPIIETNEPKQITVGDSFKLRSELLNTYLQNESVDYYKEKVKELDSPAMCAGGNLVYEPEFVIESGAELIECSREDFTHTLTASEDITFKKAGTVKIKIRYNLLEKYAFYGNDRYSPEKTITIQVKDKTQENIPVRSVSLNKKSLDLKKGQNFKLDVSVMPVNATNKEITWTTSNSKVAAVSGGKVTAKAPGTAIITAKAADGSGKSASCKVTVGYKITYKLNGGKNNSRNPSVYYKEKIKLKNPSRKGYLFKGWYTDRKYKNKIIKISAKSDKNVTLYAKWEKIKLNKPEITTLKSKSGNKALLRFTGVKKAVGYQVSYAPDRLLKSGRRTITSKSKSLTLKNLKKKSYYVKVRAYRIDSAGNKVYGKYSSVKHVRVKG